MIIKLAKTSTDVLYFSGTDSNSVKYAPPDGFFAIQILHNSILAEALPRTPHRRLRRSPDHPVGFRRGNPLRILHLIDAYGVLLSNPF